MKALASELGLDTEDEELDQFHADPVACLEAAANGDYPHVSRWIWPRDLKRVALLPPGHALVIMAPHPFRLRLEAESGRTIAAEQSHAFRLDKHFTILRREDIEPGTLKLHLTLFPEEEKAVRTCAELRALSKFDAYAPVALTLDRAQAAADNSHSLCTNGRGAMAQVRARFGEVRSQYDCLLGVNLDPNVPVDRKVMFTRCRAWISWRGRSHAVNIDTLEKFSARPSGGATWDFLVPLGGQYEVKLRVRLDMKPDTNAIDLRFVRQDEDGGPKSVKLIVRPDVEDRDNHHKTGVWDASSQTVKRGFRFPAGSSHPVEICSSRGEFIEEPEWLKDIHHPAEGERGLDDHSNLFSPGYFEAPLAPWKSVTLKARIPGEKRAPKRKSRGPKKATLGELARLRLDDFIVARDDSLTVIAGYPWFLDWGRDTLIFLRGVIAAGRFDDAIRILETFARFEDRGTLPNMIRGGDASDRDTSDAPLWFIVACADLADAHPRRAHRFLESECNGRTVVEIITSIVTHYMEGTPNGIRMDPESGLIYSPPHFTWMDTNYPPGTPRAGYPIEIQAMWVAALNFMHDLEPEGPWNPLAERACESILRHFSSGGREYLSDCLHASPGESAAEAVADDHLRSNQLLAITLNAVTDKEIGRKIVRACEELLVPGAIRSLADRPVRHALPYNKDGHILNDPHWPYWGRYSGPEDYTRKPAYHNGTAWTWTFPSYPEALYLVHGSTAEESALAVLGTSGELFKAGSIGQIPEILDGDAPHAQKGCGAQAWGVSELYRVLKLLRGS
ncbi:MAG: amylo-alpha-1,6-glucosidase [Verrucomicrobiota bacterium]